MVGKSFATLWGNRFDGAYALMGLLPLGTVGRSALQRLVVPFLRACTVP